MLKSLTCKRDLVLPANNVGVFEKELSVELLRVHLDRVVLRDVPHLIKVIKTLYSNSINSYHSFLFVAFDNEVMYAISSFMNT